MKLIKQTLIILLFTCIPIFGDGYIEPPNIGKKQVINTSSSSLNKFLISKRPEGISIESYFYNAPNDSIIIIDEDITLNSSIVINKNITITAYAESKIVIADNSIDGITLNSKKVKVTLRDLNIFGGRNGVRIKDAFFDINNLNIFDSKIYGLSIRGKASGTIDSSNFSKNKGSGLMLNSSRKVIVKNSIASNNKGHGIVLLQDSSNAQIKSVNANSNGRSGITIGRSSQKLHAAKNFKIIKSATLNNLHHGVSIDVVLNVKSEPHKAGMIFPVNALITDHISNGNKIYGYFLNAASNIDLINVTANSNKNSGIGAFSQNKLYILGLEAKYNSQYGLKLLEKVCRKFPASNNINIKNYVEKDNKLGRMSLSGDPFKTPKSHKISIDGYSSSYIRKKNTFNCKHKRF